MKNKKTYPMVLAYFQCFDHTRYLNEAGEDIGKEAYDSGDFEGEIEVNTDWHGKPGDLDRGDPKSEYTWKRNLHKEPVAKVDAYFTSEEDLADFMSIEGFEDKVLNTQTGEEKPRIKQGNEEFGIGKYIKLKRKFFEQIEFVDKKTKELKTIAKGGAPSVKILNEDGSAYVDYNYGLLGSPANGTEAKVRFEVYGDNATTRLEAFGITNLVEYISKDEKEEF